MSSSSQASPTARSGSGQRESVALPPPRESALLLVAVVGVSASAPLTAATAAPALAVAFWRNAMGAAVTSASVLATIRRSGLRSLAPPRRAVTVAAVSGLVLALHFSTWLPSVRYTAVASSTALASTQSAFAGIIAVLLGRRIPRLAWLGIGLAFAGAALIAGTDVEVSGRAVFGDLLALVGGFAAAVYMTLGARARRDMSAGMYTAICYSVCALATLVVCLVGGQPLAGYPGRAWLYIVAITVCAQLLGHTVFNVVLRTVSPTIVSLAVLLEVPGAGLIAWVWLGQTPPASAWPGLAMLFVGLVAVVRAEPEPSDID